MPLLLLLSAAFTTSCDAPRETAPPNILLILADDLGINDLESFRIESDAATQSSEHRETATPKIDALAESGLRFTRFYADSTCSATRAGILTGRSPSSVGFAPAGAGIDPELATLPEQLRSLGYSTHLVGKWHVGFSDPAAWPTAQGFDTFFGFLNQFLLSKAPDDATLGRPRYINPWLQRNAERAQERTGHLSELLLEEALQTLETAAIGGNPWFVSFWPYTPHTPLQPPAAIAKRFADTPEGRYRAMLATLDWQVAELLQQLDETGQRENTLVLFASDNGGTARQVRSNGPFLGTKGLFYEGGLRVPLVIAGPGIAAGEDQRVATYLDLAPTLLTVGGGAAAELMSGMNLLSSERRIDDVYWSSGAGRTMNGALLTADGRWRWVQDAVHPEGALFRVHADKAEERVHDKNRELEFAQRFQRWRSHNRRLPLTLDATPDAKFAVSDQIFLRSLGFGTHTIALCLTQHGLGGADGSIAGQRGLWDLRRDDDRLIWRVQNLELTVPTPPQQSGELLLVSDFNPSFAFPLRRASLAMFFDGRKLGETAIETFSIDRNLSAPLEVGRGPFAATIESMQMWNDIPGSTPNDAMPVSPQRAGFCSARTTAALPGL